jgi:hypothetical protein
LKEVSEQAKSGFEKVKIRSSLIYMDIHIYHSKHAKPLFASAKGGKTTLIHAALGIVSTRPWRAQNVFAPARLGAILLMTAGTSKGGR